MMEDLQQEERTMAELDWDEVFSLLQDYSIDPNSANLPLQPNPTELEHNYHHFCSPPQVQMDPILASLESHSQILQHWGQPSPIIAFPPMNYDQMPAYREEKQPMAAPDMFYSQSLMVPGPMMAPNPYCGPQALANIHDQYQPYQCPEAACGCPLEQPQFNVPMAPQGISMRAARIMRRQREAEGQQEKEERPYIKKPQNAFMIFLKHQRAKVVAQHGVTDNAKVNKIMGKLWKSMSAQEQAPYYEQAQAERQHHEEQNPHWSWKENYGKKRRRDRSKAARNAAAAAAAAATAPAAATENNEEID